MTGEGKRFNEGKLRYDLVNTFAHEQMVKILTFGSQKYDERNWEKGMKWSNVISSLKRHLAAIEAGEDYDKESGELHAAHLACNAHFLTAYYDIYPQGDDRPHKYLKMPKIGLDIDEVLCDWIGGWTELYNIKETPKAWYFDREIGKRFADMKEAGTLNSFYAGLKPLLKPSDIPFEPHCYITSRPCDVDITIKWLDDNGFPTKPVYCVGVGQSKVEVAIKSGLEIYVDDKFDNFTELNAAGVCTYLYSAPHNERYEVGHKRISNLNELL